MREAASVAPVSVRALTVMLVAAFAAPPAAAQEDGVFVDPDSPAGKEYAIPLDEARREAAGGGGAGRAGQPLFGAGIERAGRSDSGGQDASGNEPADPDGRRSRRSNSDETIEPSSRSVVAVEAAAGTGSDALPTAGIAAAVLAAGLLAGFGLRKLLKGS